MTAEEKERLEALRKTCMRWTGKRCRSVYNCWCKGEAQAGERGPVKWKPGMELINPFKS